MNETAPDTRKASSRWQKFQWSVVRTHLQAIAVVAVLVFGFIRPYVVEAFKIPSGSMEDTLLVGDHIFVCKFIYGITIPGTNIKILDFHKPSPGDVFVFVPPHEKTKHYIKRIVAVEGDTVETKGDTLYVNGKLVNDKNYTKHVFDPQPDFPPFGGPAYLPDDEAHTDYTLHSRQFKRKFSNGNPFTVPKGYVFAMGDNRNQSSDSRTWGPTPVDTIKGQAFIVFWSYDIRERTKPWEVWKLIGNVRFSRIGRLIRSEFDQKESNQKQG